MKAGLEVLPSIGTVDVYRTGPSGNGYSWKIHFRTEVGDLNMLTIDQTKMLGINALVSVTEFQKGDSASPKGMFHNLKLKKKLLVFQVPYSRLQAKLNWHLHSCNAARRQYGLTGYYYDNQYFLHNPVLTRIDPTINFNWEDGKITTYCGKDCQHPLGAKLSPLQQRRIAFICMDENVKMWLDHEILFDTWDLNTTYEQKAFFNFTAGKYHDIRVDYKEKTSNARIILMWQFSR